MGCGVKGQGKHQGKGGEGAPAGAGGEGAGEQGEGVCRGLGNQEEDRGGGVKG
jgi:hypothetical protein